MKYSISTGSKFSLKNSSRAEAANKTIEIYWARLLIDENTCPRCNETGQEIDSALKILQELGNTVGITIQTRKHAITLEEFNLNPSVSNQILINDEPLEVLLDAKVGMSRCCNECGDNDCRTLEVDGKSYEGIPKKLIIKAILKTIINMI